jgi:hypothetical protein
VGFRAEGRWSLGAFSVDQPATSLLLAIHAAVSIGDVLKVVEN